MRTQLSNLRLVVVHLLRQRPLLLERLHIRSQLHANFLQPRDLNRSQLVRLLLSLALLRRQALVLRLERCHFARETQLHSLRGLLHFVDQNSESVPFCLPLFACFLKSLQPCSELLSLLSQPRIRASKFDSLHITSQSNTCLCSLLIQVLLFRRNGLL